MQSFLMRVWVPASGEAGRRPSGLHGLVEHVGFHYRRPFRDELDLLAFVRDCIAETAAEAGRATTDAMTTADVPPHGYRPLRRPWLGD